jgi:ATP-dependent protease HslVU (ClpYQ) peptidase subunit
MTCIVGLVDGGNVYIGGDSAGVAGLNITIRADEKVFHNGPFIMGFTSSFRMGQLLRYKFSAPKQNTNQTDMEYMVTDFIDSVRKTFGDGGYGSTADKTDNEGGVFLVGYNGKLYHISSDFQVGVPTNKYDAVGCGAEVAKGSLYSSNGKTAQARLKLALEASAHFSGGVAPPFVFVKQAGPPTKRKAKK